MSNLKGIHCYYHLETLHNILCCKLYQEIEINYIQVITQNHFARGMLPSCYVVSSWFSWIVTCVSACDYLSALGFSSCIKSISYFFFYFSFLHRTNDFKYFIKFRFWKQEKDNKPVHKKHLIRKIMKIISLLVIKDPLTNYKRQVSIGWQLHALVLCFASTILPCSQ